MRFFPFNTGYYFFHRCDRLLDHRNFMAWVQPLDHDAGRRHLFFHILQSMQRWRAYAFFRKMYVGCFFNHRCGVDIRHSGKCFAFVECLELRTFAFSLFRTNLPALFPIVVLTLHPIDIFVQRNPRKNRRKNGIKRGKHTICDLRYFYIRG